MENTNKPIDRIESPAMWLDPDSRVTTGVLLSDRIKLYVQAVGLIEPFQEKNLGPAAYDLTLGYDCWSSDHTAETGQPKRTLKVGEPLILPPNSIVFVSSAETLNLPFYLVARFNLKLRFLHEGLLVGAGPQIDPGFLGRLSCPLHNISSEKICLTCGETFAVVEFQKTTPFAQTERWAGDLNITDVRSRGESMELKGVRGFPCLTFRSRSLNRAPIKGYLPSGKSVSSSVQGVAVALSALDAHVEKKLSEFDKFISRLNLMVFLTLLVVAISLGSYFFAVVGWHKSAYAVAIAAEEQTKELRSELGQLRLRYNEIVRKTVANTNVAGAQTTVTTNVPASPIR